MKAFIFCLAIILVLQAHFANPSPVLLSGNYLNDLLPIGSNISSLDYFAKEWTVNGVKNQTQSKTMNCFSTYMLGGKNFAPTDRLERTYDSLPSHDIIISSIRFYFSNNWQSTDYIYLLLDGQVVLLFAPSNVNAPEIKLGCGTTSNGGIINSYRLNIQGQILHNKSTLTLTTYSNSTTSESFFGLNEVKMRFTKSKQIDTPSACIASSNPSILNVGDAICQCQSGQYYDSKSSSCQTCHSNCYGCFGPSETECFGCGVDKSYSVETDSCVSCADNCTLCSGPDINQCSLCKQNSFAYWNNTCQNECNSPYINQTEGFKFCETPCQTTNGYMLWDNTCSRSCEPPLVQRVEVNAKFCDSPCGLYSDNYLYWNGSCQSTCPFSPRSANGYKYCDACQSGYFMYPNNTCLYVCPFPYKTRTEGNSTFCDLPCESKAKFFSETNQVCISKCKYPYKIRNEVFCFLELSSKQTTKLEATKATLDELEAANSLIGTAVSLITLNPSAIFANIYINMMRNVKYLNINLPPKLEYYFKLENQSPFRQFPEVPEILYDSITKETLPENFGSYRDLHSSFLINFWQSLLDIGVLFICVITFWILECVKFKLKSLESLIKQINQTLRWNYTLTLFVFYYGDIVLFASLEFRTMNLNTFSEIMSFVLCFILKMALIFSYAQIIYITQRNQQLKLQEKETKDKEELKALKKYLEKYQILFQGYKNYSFFQRASFLIFTSRILLYTIILAYLYNYPLVQVSILTTISLVMLLYSTKTRPVQGTTDICMYITQELIMLISMTCLLIMAVFDSLGVENHDFRNILGEIILGCYTTFTCTNVLYFSLLICLMVIEAIQSFVNFLEKRKSLKITPSGSESSISAQCLEVQSVRQPMMTKSPSQSTFLEFQANDSQHQKNIGLKIRPTQPNSKGGNTRFTFGDFEDHEVKNY